MHYVLTQRAIKYSLKSLMRLMRKYNLETALDTPEVYYFAYGANLSVERFHKNGMNAEFIEVAHIPGFQLTFDFPCEYKNKAYGSITSKSDEKVWGSLFKIGRVSLLYLDTLEWKIMKQYRRIKVDIVGEAKNYEDVEVYQANFPTDNLIPSTAYLQSIIKESKRLNFPQDYIDYLEKQPHQSEFELDPGFRFSNPYKRRYFEETFGEIYILHDKLREKICDLI